MSAWCATTSTRSSMALTREDRRCLQVPAIEVTDLTVAYGAKPVLWDVDLTVAPGVLMAIVGPNGAGKTTLIKAILELVRAGGRPSPDPRAAVRGAASPRRLRATATDGGLGLPDERPRRGVDGPLRRARLASPSWAPRARPCARGARAGRHDQLADRQISQLSSGQQQRVFLARALVQDARVYLMDEPFQGVDATTERAIVELLQRLRADGQDGGLASTTTCRRSPEYFDWVTLLNVRRIAAARGGGVQRGEPAADLRRARQLPGARTVGGRRQPMPDVAAATWRLLDHTLRTVALGAATLGIVSGGSAPSLLRRQSLLGDAMSHAALPGSPSRSC